MSLSASWDQFTNVVEEGLKKLVKNTVEGAVGQAEADAKPFLNDNK